MGCEELKAVESEALDLVFLMKKIAETEQMDGKEPKDFLLEKAQRVSTWISDEVVNVKGWF